MRMLAEVVYHSLVRLFWQARTRLLVWMSPGELRKHSSTSQAPLLTPRVGLCKQGLSLCQQMHTGKTPGNCQLVNFANNQQTGSSACALCAYHEPTPCASTAAAGGPRTTAAQCLFGSCCKNARQLCWTCPSTARVAVCTGWRVQSAAEACGRRTSSLPSSNATPSPRALMNACRQQNPCQEQHGAFKEAGQSRT